MERYRVGADEAGPRVEVPYRGAQLLSHAMYNKSTAFTREERASFGLDGLLPDAVSTMEMQAARVHGNIVRKDDPVERYIGLAALQDRNEHLFYRVLVDHLEEYLPIVYTPTVGRVCQMYSKIFRRARGLWITPRQRGHVFEALGNAPYEDVRLIVATDNEALLEDDLYIGWRQPRLRGDEYHALVDEFVHAVRRRFPKAVLQWEDFRKGTAFALLDRYRKVLPSFNDDIQGTAAVALAGILAASRLIGMPLVRHRIVILGAGAAGVGIARLLSDALHREGLGGADLRRAVAVLDSHGLVVEGEGPAEEYRRELAWPHALAQAHGLHGGHDLLAVVRALHPTVLIGVSGATGAFTEAVVRETAAHVQRPLIFPLSNPTSQAEASPADVLRWTDGRALVATGSPFPSIEVGGRTRRVGQGNNAFVFPGIGLGAVVAEAREVTDGMFRAAAERLADELRQEDLDAGARFPPSSALRRVTAHIAEAVVRQARADGVAREVPGEDVTRRVADAMWEPAYIRLVAV